MKKYSERFNIDKIFPNLVYMSLFPSFTNTFGVFFPFLIRNEIKEVNWRQIRDSLSSFENVGLPHLGMEKKSGIPNRGAPFGSIF